MIISCQAKTSRGASPQAKGNGRPGHRRPSSGLVLEMRRQLADSWQMRWRPSISAGVVQVSPFVLLFICDPDANPAWANLQELLGILKDPEPFLALWFGSLVQLRSGWQLARKLVLPWQQYPWRLWPLALKDVDEAKRKECARDLLRSPTCCLDSSFSRRLRHLHPRESELLSSDVQTFLATVFARIAPTSTFIER